MARAPVISPGVPPHQGAAGPLVWPDDAVEVGRVVGAWGLKGGIKVKPFASDPQALVAARRWFLKAPDKPRPMAAKVASPAAKLNVEPTAMNPVNKSAPKTLGEQAASVAPIPLALNIVSLRSQGDALVASALEIADRDVAKAMKGVRIFVSRANFPQTEPDEFYWVDLIGLAVFNREGIGLGNVVGLIDTGPHCVLRVAPLLPVADQAQPPQLGSDGPPEILANERLIPFVAAYVDVVDLAGARLVVDWQLDY